MEKCENNFETISNFVGVIFGILNSLISLLSLIGNSTIFYVFLKDRRLRKSSNLTLLSLAMTDLCGGLLHGPLFVPQLFALEMRHNCPFNTVRRFFSAFLTGASMSCIALVSYDRYMHLSKGHQYTAYMTIRKTALLIVLCWMLPGLSPLMNYISIGHAFFSSVIFIYTFVMLFIIIKSYFTIMNIVKKKELQLKQARSMAKNSGTDAVSASRLRAGRAIASVILCFILFYSPLAVYLALVAVSGLSGKAFLQQEHFDIIYIIIITVSLTNTIINPFIYYYRIPGFKETLLRRLGIARVRPSASLSLRVLESNS
ncbi:adenosine receptor A3-like [Rhopilema esculentum]|uniref:adenosine receptor A3-like n=1 Tax=Rhopilema esculentum TaxID=499914 RepID=UPI0031D9C856|eukprot:gene39-9643_t